MENSCGLVFSVAHIIIIVVLALPYLESIFKHVDKKSTLKFHSEIIAGHFNLQ